MTISSTTSRWEYTGDGSTTIFAYDNKIIASTDLKVYADGVLQSSGYTVSGAGVEAGGNVTFTTAPASGVSIIINRDTPTTQATDYPVAGSFPAVSHEDALDKLTLLVQQAEEAISRCLRFTENDTSTYDSVLPSPSSGKILSWSAAGKVANISATDVTGLSLANNVQYFSTHASMKAGFTSSTSNFAKTFGYYSEGDGGGGDYYYDASETATAEDGLYTTPTVEGSGRLILEIKNRTYDVRKFGAKLDDSTDDRESIQNAIDAAETAGRATILISGGIGRVTRNSGGTNDKWGINIKASNITLKMEDGGALRRHSSANMTDYNAYPILLVGTPDSNVAAATDKFKLKGGEFIGEDSRHTLSGSSIMDGKQAIWVKNCTRAKFYGTDYTSIDSGAIYFQQPGVRDYENTVDYNTTKNYKCKVIRNTFQGVAQTATPGRGLMHAVVTTGLDSGTVSHNESEWCDVFLASNGTYDDYDDLETDTYTDSGLGAAVKRCGRGLTVVGNTCLNSSEHAFYFESMAVSCQGNTIIVDDPTTCNTYQMQIRARGAAITGNEFWGVAAAASINVGSMDVTFASNTIQSLGDLSGGCINIQSNGLKAYIDARSDYFGSYKAMRNISVVGGSMTMPSASQTNGLAVRVYCSDDDAATFPNGEMIDLSITGMTICNAKVGFLFLGSETMMRNIKINGNTISGKLFTEATFTTGTTMNSLSVLAIDDAAAYANGFRNVEFKGNTCYGFEYVVIDHDGAGGLGSGSAGSFYLPYGFNDNGFNYFKYFDTAAFRPVDVNNRFTDNRGQYFLERTAWYTASAINNSLNTGKSGNSGFKSCITLASSDNRAYYDDSLSYDAL